jgi:threonine/homoserine/homoserine lactone efflux protein
MSPGPSFVLVAKTALSAGRRSAVMTAFGMGIAGSVFALLAVFGLATALNNVPILCTLIRFLGGGYLGFIAYSMIRHSTEPMPTSVQSAKGRSGLVQGLITQFSNPKTVVVYASVFAALLPTKPDLWLLIALPITIGLIETGWYLLVATLFAGGSASALYERRKTAIDRIAGSVMLLLALKLLLLP